MLFNAKVRNELLGGSLNNEASLMNQPITDIYNEDSEEDEEDEEDKLSMDEEEEF